MSGQCRCRRGRFFRRCNDVFRIAARSGIRLAPRNFAFMALFEFARPGLGLGWRRSFSGSQQRRRGFIRFIRRHRRHRRGVGRQHAFRRALRKRHARFHDQVIAPGFPIDRPCECIRPPGLKRLKIWRGFFEDPDRTGGLQLHGQIGAAIERLSVAGRKGCENVLKDNCAGPSFFRIGDKRRGIEMQSLVSGRGSVGGPNRCARHGAGRHRQDHDHRFHAIDRFR